MNIITMELITIIVLMAVYDDLLRYKISNKIIAFGIMITAIYFGIYLFYGIVIKKDFLLSIDIWIKDSILGFLAGFFGMFILYVFGAVGAGDVKLMGVIGLLGGIELVKYVLLYSLISGGILGILGMVLKRCENMSKYGMNVHIMHYSLAIAAGVVLGMLKVCWQEVVLFE